MPVDGLMAATVGGARAWPDDFGFLRTRSRVVATAGGDSECSVIALFGSYSLGVRRLAATSSQLSSLGGCA